MSLTLFTAVVKGSTIEYVLGGIECLEHYVHTGVVFDMDTQEDADPDASSASNLSLEERIDRESRAKQFLLQLTDLKACDPEDRRMKGITWLFHKRIEFDGQSQPV